MFLPALLNFSWLLIQVFTAFSLLVPAVFCLFYFTRRKARRPQTDDDELHEEKDYAIIVSAGEPSENLSALLRSLMQLNYTNYIVYVAGSRVSASHSHLYNEKLVYLRTTGSYHSRFFHRFVIENFKRPHTHVVVLNGNSMVDENYLTCLNTFFNQGYQAVTCPQRHQSRNGIANGLQMLIHSYRNFFAGKLMFSLGSSAVLSGSGTGFTVSGFKTCLKTKTENIGFAPMLQTKLVKRRQQIAFASDAVVHTNSEVTLRQLAGQHAQRVHDWLLCLLFSFQTIITGAGRRNINQLLSGLFSLRMPLPTSVLMGIACLAVNARINPALASVWVGILSLALVSVVIAAMQAPEQNHQRETGAQGEESIALYAPEEEYGTMMQTV